MTTAAPPDSELVPYAMEYYFQYMDKMVRITRFTYNGGLMDNGTWAVCIARSSTNPWYLNHGGKYHGTWQYKHGTPFASAEDALKALKQHGVIDDAKSEARLDAIRAEKDDGRTPCGNRGGEQLCASDDPAQCSTHWNLPDYWRKK